MSQIAQALAKAKERTGHTTAPFMVPGIPAPAREAERAAATAAALRRARMRQRIWIAIVAVALPLTAFVVWTRVRDEAPRSPGQPATSAAVETIASSSGSASGASAGVGGAAPASAVRTGEPARGAPLPSAKANSAKPAAGQRPELIQLVTGLAISAVMPGDPARIMLAGRVVRAGEAIDGGLTFAGIADGQLRFTDAEGVVYTRHY